MRRDLTLDDLVDYSGLTSRTLRFYMQEGILQGPDTRGKYATYSQHHLDRLELIQRLKNLRLPIKEIRHLLENMSPDEISQVRSYQDTLNPNLNQRFSRQKIGSEPTKTDSSALEYIRSLQHGRENIQTISDTYTRRPTASKQSVEEFRAENLAANDLAANDLPTHVLAVNSPSETEYPEMLELETWKRIVLCEGIELNIREPVNTNKDQIVMKLIEFARTLFAKHS